MVLFLHLAIDMLCAVMAAAGFFMFHIAVRQPSTAIRVAGAILILVGVSVWLGNSYYGLRYWRDGYFDTPLMHEDALPKHPRSDTEDDN